jgi:hypothetical protein
VFLLFANMPSENIIKDSADYYLTRDWNDLSKDNWWLIKLFAYSIHQHGEGQWFSIYSNRRINFIMVKTNGHCRIQHFPLNIICHWVIPYILMKRKPLMKKK